MLLTAVGRVAWSALINCMLGVEPRSARAQSRALTFALANEIRDGSSFGSKSMRAGGSVDLVEREQSHFFLWATCVECLTEILISVPAAQRETTVYILGATWRLLPSNRLRAIRICLLRL